MAYALTEEGRTLVNDEVRDAERALKEVNRLLGDGVEDERLETALGSLTKAAVGAEAGYGRHALRVRGRG